MNKHLRLIYLLLLLFGLNIQTIKAQSDFASEEEFKKQAAKLFDEEEFEKAYPLYSQLVSLYRKDPNYNYRLGVCMLYASDEKERAITFLEFATKNKDVEKEAFFFLAKAYHLNYRFDDAIGQYLVYKKIASGAKAERFQVDRQIEMCNNGKTLLRNISDLPVIEKTEMSREDFFRSYDISEIGGKMLVKPDEKEFRTPLDKKKKEKSILYLATNSNQIYFSSYGDNEQTGKNIYRMKKTPSGEWGKPETIGNNVNTKYDEDFPFLHPNGKVLYFCSKGHNSMGGYDIFKTTLNEETNLWNEPVNMDFPINTPDDDILYVTNADEKKAFFASARSSVAGKIAVYHISVERRPIDFAIIKGIVVKNHNVQALNIKITVKNVNDNTILGIFNTTATGSYDIKLPNGGSFLFTVETPDFATQSEVVTIPVQTEFRPLKQEIIFQLPTDKLLIKNLFDEAISDSNYLLAINVIKEKAKMDVVSSTESAISTTKEDSVSASETAIVQTTTTPKTTKTLSNDDIIKIAYNDASIVDTEATNAREQADIAMSFANQKNEQAQSKSKEADGLTASASATDDNIKKQALTDEANATRTEAERLNKETVVAYNLAKRIDATAIAKKEEADLSMEYAKELEVAVKSKNSKESKSKLDELEKKLDALSLSNADRFPVLNSYKKEEENKKHELDQTIQASSNLKKDIADNETIISDLKIEAANTKNSQVKQGLDNQIAELVIENGNKQKELEQNQIKLVKVEKEYSGIKNEADLVSTVVDQSKTGSSETAAANVAAIDKNKLEQQVNSIKTSDQSAGNTTASNATGNTTTNTVSSGNTNASTTGTNTTAKAFSDINKQYSAELATAEKIKDKDEREKEKATVLKKWSEAIDDDVAKQKADYISETDPEMKALLAKKISDAENSSKEKNIESQKSLAKVNQSAIAVNTTTENTNTKNNVNTINNNADKTNTSNPEANKTGVVAGTENQFVYNNASATEEITKANLVNKQADTLASYSVDLRSKAAKEKNVETKKILLEQSNDILEQSKEKKIQAAELNSKANKTEYTSNKVQLDNLAKSYSTNTSDDISMADMNNDEALIYFEKAQKLHTRADTTKSLDEKELLLDDANKNEILALEKQKRSTDIYKNHNATVAGTTNSNSNNISNPVNSNTSTLDNPTSEENSTLPVNANTAGTSKTTATALIDINKKYKADLATAEKNTNEGDREKEKADVLKKWAEAIDADIEKQEQDYASTTDPEMKALLLKKISDAEISSKEKKTQAGQSFAKAESLKPENTGNTNNSGSTKKQFSYNDPAAGEQMAKANILNQEANDLLAQSLVYKLETVDKTSASAQKERDKQGDELVKRSQDKKLEAFQLVTTANKTEYTSNQNQIDQLAKASSTNTSPDLLKAEILNDESKKYFDNAQKQRNNANKITSYYSKEKALEEAENNEMLALEKQKEAFGIYKSYNPNVVASSVIKDSTSITKTNEPTNAIANTASTENQNTYNEPAAKDQILKAELLNKEADVVMGQSVELKSQAAKSKNTTTKNTIYAQSEELMKEGQDKKLRASQLTAAANTTQFDSNQNELDQLASASSSNASAEILKAEITNDEAKTFFDNAKKQRIKASTTDSYSAKETELEAARKNEMSALEKQKEAMDIYKKYNPNFVASAVNTAGNNSVANNSINSGTSTTPVTNAMVNNTGSNTSTALNTNSGGNTSLPLNSTIAENADNTSVKTAPSSEVALSPNEVFEQKSTPIYSLENPIPINKKLPEGLIFKVQIGAFRKPIPQDLFQGMSPITGETTAKGFIRYTVGIFEKFTTADKVKNKIIGMGYKDAFIVAFLNGKRIPINEAYAMAGGVPSTVLQINNPIVNTENTTVQPSDQKTIDQAAIVKTTNELSAIAKTENVASVQGLFYTVQVGVFSQPVVAGKLYNMKPLYTETAANGNLRYYTGIYKSVSRAAEATEMINDVGIKDAFVTAYYNGKRISLAEAKQYEKQGDGVFTTGDNVNKLPVFTALPKQRLVEQKANVDEADKGQPAETNPALNQPIKDANPISTEANNSGIIFKIQIGAFNDEVPLEIANKFIKIASKGIKTYKDNNGLTVYTVGNLKTYDEANLLKSEVVAESLTDAFIIAFRNGEKIPVEEARK
ncbi:MAG: hypothetical protein V4511_07625 [Bacteroidota bacterium]